MTFDNKNAMINYYIQFIKLNDDISIICDKEATLKIIKEFFIDKYQYKNYIGVNYQSDVLDYNIDIIKDICLCIEPIKRNNQYYHTCDSYILVDKNVLNRNKELIKYLHADDEIIFTDYKR